MQYRFFWAIVFSIAVVGQFGCGGPGDTVINTQQMTPEEIQKMVADDQAVEDEESKGAMAKQRSKKTK
ncbi:hypothetical protein VN12_08795 [Pirellula sp. SH-Sr6A]|uniref:hypothetical protein n=1 Tax=Pirellula sp. SH-Sr6A TaxID=1632865 RepID=UPI00078EA4A4|nr:hypothetical protein [Pirellula sp. SH-Sr6A]AMV32207.1 hypothetical protein VN12_08795 [Pirellula sp. SH-Sr6A]